MVREIATDPKLAKEARAVAPALARWAAPAGDSVLDLLKPLTINYRELDMEAWEWAVFWKTYIDVLGKLPVSSVRHAISEYGKAAKFFPKPGDLYPLAEKHASPLWVAAWRARKVVDHVEPERPSKLTPEQDAALKERMRAEGVIDEHGKLILPKPGDLFERRRVGPPVAHPTASRHEVAQAIRDRHASLVDDEVEEAV